MSHPCTKVLFLSLELDRENLNESWGLGHFDSDEQLRAAGQSFYTMTLEDDLRHMLKGVHDGDDS